MTRKRQTDTKIQTWYRTERVVRDQGSWFFHTREHTIEGPFESEHDAQTRLDAYVKVQKSGIIRADSTFSLSVFDLECTE